MGGRYVYEFKIIFFQCFHMLLVEWQEKWKGGGGDESVTRLRLFKITLKFCKTLLFHSPPFICSLFTWPWGMGGFSVLCPGPPVWCANTLLNMHTVVKEMATRASLPHFCSSGVMDRQSYPASPVITGSWHNVSTVAKSCTERQSYGSFLPRTREELLFNFLDFRAAKMAKSVVARWWLSPLDQKSLNNPKDNDDITII